MGLVMKAWLCVGAIVLLVASFMWIDPNFHGWDYGIFYGVLWINYFCMIGVIMLLSYKDIKNWELDRMISHGTDTMVVNNNERDTFYKDEKGDGRSSWDVYINKKKDKEGTLQIMSREQSDWIAKVTGVGMLMSLNTVDARNCMVNFHNKWDFPVKICKMEGDDMSCRELLREGLWKGTGEGDYTWLKNGAVVGTHDRNCGFPYISLFMESLSNAEFYSIVAIGIITCVIIFNFMMKAVGKQRHSITLDVDGRKETKEKEYRSKGGMAASGISSVLLSVLIVLSLTGVATALNEENKNVRTLISNKTVDNEGLFPFGEEHQYSKRVRRDKSFGNLYYACELGEYVEHSKEAKSYSVNRVISSLTGEIVLNKAASIKVKDVSKNELNVKIDKKCTTEKARINALKGRQMCYAKQNGNNLEIKYDPFKSRIESNIKKIEHVKSKIINRENMIFQNKTARSLMRESRKFNLNGQGLHTLDDGWKCGWATQSGVYIFSEDNCPAVNWNGACPGPAEYVLCDDGLEGECGSTPGTFNCKPTSANVGHWRGANGLYSVTEEWAGQKEINRVWDYKGCQLQVVWEYWDQDNIQPGNTIMHYTFTFMIRATGSCTNEDLNLFLQPLNSCPNADYVNFEVANCPILIGQREPGNKVVDNIDKAYTWGPTENADDSAVVAEIVKSNIWGNDGETRLIAVYYNLRFIGPVKADIMLFGYRITTIAMSSDACPNYNDWRVKGICMELDWTEFSFEAPVTGFPAINTHVTLQDRAPGRTFSVHWFYFIKPKPGASVFLSIVSDSASIGYFSESGLCTSTYTNPELDELYCSDGTKANAIPIVQYATPYRFPVADINCKNTDGLTCNSDKATQFVKCDRDRDGKRSACYRAITKTASIGKTDDKTESLTGGNTRFMLAKGDEITGVSNVGRDVGEMFYRSPYLIVFMALLSSSGFWCMMLLLLFIMLGFIRMDSFAIANRKLSCPFCCTWVYSKKEEMLHALCCPSKICPICIIGNNGKPQFLNGSEFKCHMKLHSARKYNRVIYRIKVNNTNSTNFVVQRAGTANNNTQTVAKALFIMAMVVGSNAQVSWQPVKYTGLRSNMLGTEVDVPADNWKCESDLKCSIETPYTTTMPLVHGFRFSLGGKFDDQIGRQSYTIKNPRLQTTCSTDYYSMSSKMFRSRVNYACTGSTDCTDPAVYLYEPLSGHTSDAYIVVDPEQALKDYYCPKCSSCANKIVGFFWATAACFSIDDGSSAGYVSVGANISSSVAIISTCIIGGISFEICPDDEECITVNNNDLSDIETFYFNIHGPTAVKTEFKIATITAPGSPTPYSIFYDAPGILQGNAGTPFALKMKYVPMADTCMEGTTFDGLTCNLNTGGARPTIDFQRKVSEVTVSDVSRYLDALDAHVQCNNEDTTINWNRQSVGRNIKVGSVEKSDSQDVQVATVSLSLDHCSMGNMAVTLQGLPPIQFSKELWEGEVKSSKCEGEYNRNHAAYLTLEMSTIKEGYGVLDCGNNVESSGCNSVINSGLTCNITVSVAVEFECSINNNPVFTVGCQNLTYGAPDPSSGTQTGETGSDTFASWNGFWDSFTKTWWGILATVLGCLILVIGVILLIWMLSYCCDRTKEMQIKKYE